MGAISPAGVPDLLKILLGHESEQHEIHAEREEITTMTDRHDTEGADFEQIRNVDIGRAARMALASQNHDGPGMELVLREASTEDEGLARLISALAAQGGSLAARLSPNDVAAPLLRLVDTSMRYSES
ncbi:hypothetical protein QMK17_13020 [Rhodococcus sp. G-MC3]|uniref:hypothetical protein n=1 Tax=Rhodococcus sp. G-MC3 TaxID=3046209 RepID=UPI0024BA49A4|nr:hypothetical protein [Rhodococcus sp. G-MC3]MDJ0394248.1 hypothetical protein [Rhodococcus sp. G-MC3]